MDEALLYFAGDEHFAPLVAKYGRPTIVRPFGPFQALVRSIIYQQVSGAAAASIMTRFVALFALPEGAFPTPAQVAAMPKEKLRSAGLSAQKATYILDLAQKCADGSIRQETLITMRNDELTEHLTAVKGIGVWTVHMFLIFTLGRLDVLPVGDLGVQKGMKILYNMRKLPTPKQMERRAKPWRNYASVASWYLWQVANDAPPMRQKLRKK